MFCCGNEERIVGEVVLGNQVKRLANLPIEVGYFRQVSHHGIAGFGCIHERVRELYVFGGILAAVALVPRSMRLVRSEEQAEGRTIFFARCDE